MCLRISKKRLAIIFELYSRRTGRHYPERLRKEVFTDAVLEELGLSAETYRRTRVFDAATTMKIISYFSIPQDALNKNL